MHLRIQSSPHISAKDSVPMIMLRVIIALLPAFIFAVYLFGIRVLLVFIICLITAVISETGVKLARKRPIQLHDLSTVVTALLLTMTLPPTIQWQPLVIGTAIAIIFGKELFGGLGFNIFNPALVGRAFMQAAFPVDMTRFSDPVHRVFTHTTDIISNATPLGFMKYSVAIQQLHFNNFLERLMYEKKYFLDFLIGNKSGTIGETSVILLLLGGLFLFATATINWRIPAGIIITAFCTSLIFSLINPDRFVTPVYTLLTGGLTLGTFFMATDMVTSPLTSKGAWIFSVTIGLLIILIRNLGGLPEGVMYAILLANAFVPIINRFTRPAIYGQLKEKKYGAV